MDFGRASAQFAIRGQARSTRPSLRSTRNLASVSIGAVSCLTVVGERNVARGSWGVSSRTAYPRRLSCAYLRWGALAATAAASAADLGVLASGLVDVVAEAQDQVEILLLGQSGMSAVEPVLVVLAGPHADPQGFAAPGRPRRGEPPDGRRAGRRLEAVPVALAWVQAAGDGCARGVVTDAFGPDQAPVDDPGEPFVTGDLEAHVAGAVQAADVRPQRRRARPGESGHHPAVEDPAGNEPRSPAGRRRDPGRENERRCRRSASGQELPPLHQMLFPRATVHMLLTLGLHLPATVKVL